MQLYTPYLYGNIRYHTKRHANKNIKEVALIIFF